MEQQIELKKFRIRCSAIGAIMTEPRGKSIADKIADLSVQIQTAIAKADAAKPGSKTEQNARAKAKSLNEQLEKLRPLKDTPNLSQTCISFLEKWVSEQVYARRVEFTSKQTTKGNKVEDDAIVYASCHIPEMGLAVKNEEHFKDEHFLGTPDVIGDEEVFDNKSSWSHDTFPLYANELPESDYEWQVLGYMALTGKEKGRIVYTLMSMPEEMIEREARFRLGPNFTQDQYKEFAAQFKYDDLPPFLRLKEFPIAYDADKIEAIRRRVEQCRGYINQNILPTLHANADKYK